MQLKKDHATSRPKYEIHGQANFVGNWEAFLEGLFGIKRGKLAFVKYISGFSLATIKKYKHNVA